jgi:serine/threonine protein kinase
MESLMEDDPSSLGGYELQARLGEGGFGLVYLALSPGGRAVAIKVLQRELARDPEFLGRFRLEVAAAQRVNGLYTAPVVAYGLDDRPPWVATAFVPGPPLNQIVSRSGPLPEAAMWRLLAGLVEALQAIHACGIVHRDLKPANVLIAADGPRVIDFGISKTVDGTSMTSTGAVFGTPGFMAPEQAEGNAVGPATDVFALGCVLAYASAGVSLFGVGSVASVLYRIVHSAPVLDGVPVYLRGVVEMCLAKDPAARPGLGDLASIGRDGPGGMLTGHSATSFWPPQFTRLIREYQDRLDTGITTGKMADRHSPAHLAPSARSVTDATHLPAAASPALSSARHLPGTGAAHDRTRTGSNWRGVTSSGTWQPQSTLQRPQFPQPPSSFAQSRSAPPAPAAGIPAARRGSARYPSATTARNGGGEAGLRRQRSRARRNALAIWAAGVAVVLVAGVAVALRGLLLGAGPPGQVPASSDPTHKVVVPQAMDGFTRSTSLEKQLDVSADAQEVSKKSSDQASDVVTAVYQSNNSGSGSNAQMFIFVGGKLAGADPKASLVSFKQTYQGAADVAPGSLGGQAACTETRLNAQSASMCVWFDDDTFGDLVSPTMTVAKLAATLVAVRPSIEQLTK